MSGAPQPLRLSDASSPRGAEEHVESAHRRMIAQGKQLVRDGVNSGQQRLVEEARVLFDGATELPTLAPLAHYHAAYAEYRLARMKFDAAGRERLAHVRRAIAHLKVAVAADPDFAEALALLSVCYGMEMAKRLHLSLRNGPAANIAMGRARGLAPMNPRVSFLYAINLANKPALLGGGDATAQRAYETAIQLFPRWTTESELHPDWGFAEAYAMLGIGHYRAKNQRQARAAFDRALELSPDFALVKLVWLPRLLRDG